MNDQVQGFEDLTCRVHPGDRLHAIACSLASTGPTTIERLAELDPLTAAELRQRFKGVDPDFVEFAEAAA